MTRPCRVAHLVAAFCSLVTVARAQTTESKSFPAERMRITTNRNGLIDVEWARVLPHLSFDVGLWMGYANNPLVLYRLSDGTRIGPLVSDRLGGGLIGSVGLFNWVDVGLELPLIFFQTRPNNQPEVSPDPLGGVSVGGVGDLRLMPKVRFLRSDEHYIDFALVLGLTFPTGGAREYLGDRSVSFTPELLVSRSFETFENRGIRGLRLAFNLGFAIRPTSQFLNQIVEHELMCRLGVGYRFSELGLLPFEADLSLAGTFSLVRPFQNANQNALELKAQLGYHFPIGLLPFLGFGVGLSRGWGTPDFRIFAGLRFGWVKPVAPASAPASAPLAAVQEPDSDGDGLLDSQEQTLGTNPSDRDSDDDGVMDGKELLPAEDTDKDGQTNALDWDADDDGLFDGTELSIVAPDNDTDLAAAHFLVDEDPKTQTDPLSNDTDKGSASDGEEDLNKNGRVDEGERDPLAAGDDIPDADKDGISDANDKCPSDAEDKDQFDDEDGCPDPDNDNDGTLDAADECPTVAGPVRGCPDKDTDGDTVPDSVDNCPADAGDPKFSGCKAPQLVVMKGDKLELLENVFFEPGKDIIKPQSYALLDNVASVLNAHGEIRLIRVDGHTDSQGDKVKNLDLSQRRAAAVGTYMQGKGVDPLRLEIRGFGDAKPVASNASPAGRAKNRRVEFLIADEPPPASAPVP